MKNKSNCFTTRQNVYLPFKRILDILCSSLAIIVFSPLYILIAILIKITSKGPIFFRQKRIGKNKKVFSMLKFRTMRIDAPHDTATHLLENPDKYITKIGRFLRKTSLDEIPQAFNIFVGHMSVVGPRPALWNQFDLIEERDKYNANSIKPGLSGWAQCNGRDTLPISEKAKLDGDYLKRFNLWFDTRVILQTIFQAFSGKDEVEGKVNKKKICIIVTIPMTIEWFVDPFARELNKMGYSISVICNNADDSFIKKYDYLSFIFVPMSRGFNFNTFFSAKRKITEVFERENFYAIIYATPGAAYYASCAAKKAHVSKRIFLNWGYRFFGERNRIKRILAKHFEKNTFKNSTYTFIVSQKNMEIAIKNRFVKKDQISVIGKGGVNGVDITITDSVLSKKTKWLDLIKTSRGNPFVFGCTARFNRDKGVNELYFAFKKFMQNHSGDNVLLVFQGPIDEMDKVTAETYKAMKEDSDVLMIDRQKHLDTLEIINCFDVFVLPTRRDGFGTSLQEAMALKKPCITTDIPGPSEVIREGIDGLLIESNNYLSLLAAMEELYLDEAKRKEYGESAYLYAKEYYDSRNCVPNYALSIHKKITDSED